MTPIQQNLNFRKIIQFIGAGFLLLGIFALIVAPIEIFTYYSFTSGGKFHYEGFEFGSLMFAIITIQVIGYYAISLICIPLGYAHLRLHPWARKFSLTLLWDWLVLGGPLSIIAFLMLVTSKDLPPDSLPFLGLIFVGIYPIMPFLFIKLYNSQGIKKEFQQPSDSGGWFELTPQIILVSGSLMIFFILAINMPLLFNGIFPFFGKFTSGSQGVQLIDLSVIILVLLTWGVLTKKIWAWGGSVLYFLIMILTSTITFLRNPLKDLFTSTKFAPLEQEILLKMPFQGYHFLIFFSIPLIITLIILIKSKPHFNRKPVS